jgi:RND family efflux transporter MFP subunit
MIDQSPSGYFLASSAAFEAGQTKSFNTGKVAAKRRVNAVALVLMGSALAAFGCGQPPPPPQVKPAEAVVTSPVTGTVTDYADFTGRLDALKTVDMRARVSGYVLSVPFKEGDEVKEGALLFQIDPQPYQADLDQAEANLKLAIADRNLQERNAKRAHVMIGGGSIGKEEYDTIIAARAKAIATEGAAKAALDKAKLYLSYTRVTAPVSGRISRRNVDPGNLVKADDYTMYLTRIVTEDPMYAYFDVDERTYLNLLQSSGVTQASAAMNLSFPVLMSLANESQDRFPHKGTINFVDNRVEPNTGTIRMRGVFENHDRALKPGMFVRIRLPLGAPYQATLVEDKCLMSDQGRKYVFVVDKEGKAVYRPVECGQAVHGKRAAKKAGDKDLAETGEVGDEVLLRVIKKPAKGKEGKEGLEPGEKVIVSGQQRVRRGASVHCIVQAPPLPPGPVVQDPKDSLTSSLGSAQQSQSP